MNLLPHLVTAVIFTAIGIIYGSWASDHYWKERINGHDKTDDQNI